MTECIKESSGLDHGQAVKGLPEGSQAKGCREEELGLGGKSSELSSARAAYLATGADLRAKMCKEKDGGVCLTVPRVHSVWTRPGPFYDRDDGLDDPRKLIWSQGAVTQGKGL